MASSKAYANDLGTLGKKVPKCIGIMCSMFLRGRGLCALVLPVPLCSHNLGHPRDKHRWMLPLRGLSRTQFNVAAVGGEEGGGGNTRSSMGIMVAPE